MTSSAPRNSNQLQYATNRTEIKRKKSGIFEKQFEVSRPADSMRISDPMNPAQDVLDETSLLNDYYGYLHRTRYDQEINRRASFWKFVLSWASLFVCVLASSSIGPFFLIVDTESQLLKSAWRLWITSALLLPFVYYEYKKDKEKAAFNRKVLLKPALVKSLMLASLANAIWVSALVYAINYTSMAQAYLFNNCQSFTIVFYKYLTRQKVTQYEFIGILLAAVGAIFVASDNDIYSFYHVDFSHESSLERFLAGDLLAFMGSIAAAAFFLINADVKHKYPLYMGITVQAVLGSIYMSLFSLLFEGANFSFDASQGIFGLFTEKWIGIFIIIGIVTGLGGYVLQVVLPKLLNSLIVTVSLNFEPVFSAIIVWLFGMQSLPGSLTYIGACFIIPGMIFVVLGQDELKRQEGFYSVEMERLSVASTL